MQVNSFCTSGATVVVPTVRVEVLVRWKFGNMYLGWKHCSSVDAPLISPHSFDSCITNSQALRIPSLWQSANDANLQEGEKFSLNFEFQKVQLICYHRNQSGCDFVRLQSLQLSRRSLWPIMHRRRCWRALPFRTLHKNSPSLRMMVRAQFVSKISVMKKVKCRLFIILIFSCP